MSDDRFSFTYSPARNAEAQRIVSKYTEEKPDKDLEELKRLDRQAERPGTFAGIFIGLSGTVILALSINYMVNSAHFVAGLFLSLLGLLIAGSAAPISLIVTKKNRMRYKDRILELNDKINNKR